MEKHDENLEYHAETQTLVGQKKRELVDTETGEVIHVDQITKRVYGTKNFWKMYLMDFLTVLGIIDNKQLDVFIYIAENTNHSNNLFIGTYRSISKDVGVGVSTVTRIMKKLQESNFIKKKQNGVYIVNPNIMMKGNDTKRQILLSYYEEDKPLNSIDILRGKQKALPEQETTKNESKKLGLETKNND
ncbi:replication/maintenance protein RepL [Bacillus cereus]|uniref:replication/maintenance protein RepL n=1 Tax=Bacillus TaxID=1386 RepID=UPI001C824CD3|nr:replication/maintenance protein RepL [Bacillus sp. BML-BC060]HDR8250489.1 replication/maintenance protein RepL [Bacillus cereus]HDR8256016.1 replication/maintenance protein RepL [Bacillus cereus]